jgi:translation initiation factor 4G
MQDLTEFFKKMKERSQERGVISSRIRFMIQDVIDLRKGKRIPRRNDSAPKTLNQIRKEAEQGVGISNYC